MMVKILAFIQQNIAALKLCLIGLFSTLIILSRVGWVAGLMVNKANLSRADLAAGRC